MRASEIIQKLAKDKETKEYLKVVDEQLEQERICRVLIFNGLAQKVGAIGRDLLLRAVPLTEFKSKMLKMLRAFEKTKIPASESSD